MIAFLYKRNQEKFDSIIFLYNTQFAQKINFTDSPAYFPVYHITKINKHTLKYAKN